MAMVALPTLAPIRGGYAVRGAQYWCHSFEYRVNIQKKFTSSNPFSLLINLFGTVLEQVKKKDIALGIFSFKT
jgi:hypothetical protein